MPAQGLRPRRMAVDDAQAGTARVEQRKRQAPGRAPRADKQNVLAGKRYPQTPEVVEQADSVGIGAVEAAIAQRQGVYGLREAGVFIELAPGEGKGPFLERDRDIKARSAVGTGLGRERKNGVEGKG